MGDHEADAGDGGEAVVDPGEEHDAQGDGEPQAEAPRRSQRRRLVKAKAEDLGEWSFFQEHQPGEPYEVVVRGEGIGDEGGNATKIGAAITKIARLLEDLVPGEVQIAALAFGNSVHIEFRPSKEEERRAEKELEQARRLQSEQKAVVTQAQEQVVKRTLERALTNIQLSTALAADLIETSALEAPEHAVRLGTAVAQTYKSLASTVAREHLTLALEAPERDEPVRLSPNKAERVADALRQVTEPTTFIEVVVGTLSIADATQKTFGLAFDPAARKPEAFRNRRLLRGSYTPEVEEKIIERGLWGRRVRATIEVERDRLVSTSTIRPPEYRLLDVEEAIT